MSTVNFIMKIGRYSPVNILVKDKYDAYCHLTTNDYSPPLSFSGMFQSFKTGLRLKSHFSIEQIFSSPLLRARQTAGIISLSYLPCRPGICVMPELSEIPFNMADLLTKGEYRLFGSALVRQRFIDSFIANRLLLPRHAIQSGITKVLKICQQKSNLLFISHSFFIKLLTAYIDCPDIFDSPRLLKNHFNPGIRTFDFNQIIVLKSENRRMYYKMLQFNQHL